MRHEEWGLNAAWIIESQTNTAAAAAPYTLNLIITTKECLLYTYILSAIDLIYLLYNLNSHLVWNSTKLYFSFAIVYAMDMHTELFVFSWNPNFCVSSFIETKPKFSVCLFWLWIYI